MAQTQDVTENGAREVVLYVEDHPVNAVLMRTVFEHRPELELVIVVDGATATDSENRHGSNARRYGVRRS